jgi:ribosomal protein S18 acetylase RimI-like enzyme
LSGPDRERSAVEQLDNPVWWALAGTQRDLGVRLPRAGRYHPDIAPYGGLAPGATRSCWEELAELIGPQGTVVLTGDNGQIPAGWTVVREIAAVQMLGDRLHQSSARSRRDISARTGRRRDTVVPLGADEVADMLALVAEARPGPFLSRTVEFGGYLGIRRRGRLIAMAGERIGLTGFSEISAVATHPDHRRQGLAGALIEAVAEAIMGRDLVPFLHASADNTDAIRLYESLGFSRRRTVSFVILQAPKPRATKPG